jgi:hypothetical protein
MGDTKHMEFLQAAVARMASNSFLAKGWSITLTTALLALAVKEAGARFALIGLLPILLFAMVDAYYLSLERGFRDRFKEAAGRYVRGEPADFAMSPTFTFASLVRAAFRPAVFLVHAPLLLILVIVYYRLRGAP